MYSYNNKYACMRLATTIATNNNNNDNSENGVTASFN